MWTYEHSDITDLQSQDVWNALRDLHTGALTYPGADHFEIHGPFAIGTKVSVTPVGQGTFLSTIVDLKENETYADKTSFQGLTLLFRHTLQMVAHGTKVTHRLEISGRDADIAGAEIGPQISGDFPESMQALFTAARQRREIDAR